MGKWISLCALFSAIILRAQTPDAPARPPLDSTQQRQVLDRIKKFAETYLVRISDVSCVRWETGIFAPSTNLVIDLADLTTARARAQGDRTLPTGTGVISDLFQDVFSSSSGTEFKWVRWANLRGKIVAVYSYLRPEGGSEARAGLIYADETTGDVSRIILRGTNTLSPLSCSP
jgi:hypothetical protein